MARSKSKSDQKEGARQIAEHGAFEHYQGQIPQGVAAYLTAHQQQSANAAYQQHHSQLQSMAASTFLSSAATQIHLLQQQQQAQHMANLAATNNNNTPGTAAVLLPSIAMPVTTASPMEAATTCPYHHTPPIDSNNNAGLSNAARQRLRMNDTNNNNNNTFIDEILIQQRQAQLLGQTSLAPMNNNLNEAIKMFHSKFYEKTHNQFLDSQDNFQKVSGKYDLIRIDYTRKVVTEEEEHVQKKEGQENGQSSVGNGKKEPPKSSLDEKVKQLMQTICDMRIMESEAQRLDYDFKRIPLGKITKEQIKAGYEALTRIEKYIRDQEFGQEFKEAVNEYYTRIPHSFGMRIPPMITTTEMLKHEIDLLDLLTGIEIAVKEIAGDPIDTHYSRLKWELTPLDKDDEKFKLIEEYLRNTQGPTHYQYRLNLRNIFELQSRDEKGKHFREDLGNRKLLWHGSRLTNWYSILAQGLRIAPPEAPVTGYMFGKGVYFADCSTKSANYSMGGPGKPGFMLLSEVALGEILELRQADDQIHNKLPSQKQSVRGIGRMLPNPREAKTIDGIEVPCGKLLSCGDDATSLIYNEFIVYNLSQIRERFLVEIEFQFDFNI